MNIYSFIKSQIHTWISLQNLLLQYLVVSLGVSLGITGCCSAHPTLLIGYFFSVIWTSPHKVFHIFKTIILFISNVRNDLKKSGGNVKIRNNLREKKVHVFKTRVQWCGRGISDQNDQKLFQAKMVENLGDMVRQTDLKRSVLGNCSFEIVYSL